MFVLDTNVVSELMRQFPSPVVEEWVADRPAGHLFFTSVGEAELRFGVEILPVGARRDALTTAIEGVLREDFANRVLQFDSPAARKYAEIAAARRAAGRPISHTDCQIAAIARSRGGTVVTRNTRDFEGIDIAVLNPWESR